jgi:hypothetical protein
VSAIRCRALGEGRNGEEFDFRDFAVVTLPAIALMLPTSVRSYVQALSGGTNKNQKIKHQSRNIK